MSDFNKFVSDNGEPKKKAGGAESKLNGGLLSMINSLASKFNGASENDILKAVYAEAEKGRKNGTLSDADLDSFATMLAPLLDEKKRAKLKKVIDDLKKR